MSPYDEGVMRAIDSAAAGIDYRVRSFESAAARIARPGNGETLVRDIVQTMDAVHGVAANAQVIRTADEMLGTLIDIFA